MILKAVTPDSGAGIGGKVTALKSKAFFVLTPLQHVFSLSI